MERSTLIEKQTGRRPLARLRVGVFALHTLAMALVIIFSFAEVSEAACTGSSPRWTSTPDYASLSSCVSVAARNDTINVSAGNVVWNTNILMLSRGIKLLGAGRDVLTITSTTQNGII